MWPARWLVQHTNNSGTPTPLSWFRCILGCRGSVSNMGTKSWLMQPLIKHGAVSKGHVVCCREGNVGGRLRTCPLTLLMVQLTQRLRRQ